jgi:glucosamine--fructose-6-phosphate aminotransferase (isomerizing)
MGGIVGTVGRRDIVAQLVQGIGRLPYDPGSACGIATVSVSAIDVRKDVGPLAEVCHKRDFYVAKGRIGIGHLGRLQSRNSRKNAQPHVSCDEKFAVVSEGVIANSERIKANLATNGRHFFFSEAAAEVFGHLVEEAFRATRSVEEAFAHALSQTEGDFAVAVISTCESPRIFCAHKNRPLLIGTEDQATVVSSCSNAFRFESNPYPIGAGEYAILSDSGFTVGSISRHDKGNLAPTSLLLVQ